MYCTGIYILLEFAARHIGSLCTLQMNSHIKDNGIRNTIHVSRKCRLEKSKSNELTYSSHKYTHETFSEKDGHKFVLWERF